MRGSTLVVVASPEARSSGWALQAVVRIARRRAGRTGRLLLADLDLEHPGLHTELGFPGGEGVTDILLYGASLRRVARPVDDGFMFVPAGTPVADPARALTSPRLDAVVEGFERAGAELFLFLPWESPARDSVLARTGNLVLLARRGEADELEVPDLEGLRVGAVLGPVSDGDEGEPETDPTASGDVAEASDMSDVPAAEPPPPGRERDPEEVDALSSEEGEEGEEGGEGESPGETGTGRSRRTVVIVLMLVLLLVSAVVGAGLLGLVDIPGVPVLDGAPEILRRWGVA